MKIEMVCKAKEYGIRAMKITANQGHSRNGEVNRPGTQNSELRTCLIDPSKCIGYIDFIYE